MIWSFQVSQSVSKVLEGHSGDTLTQATLRRLCFLRARHYASSCESLKNDIREKLSQKRAIQELVQSRETLHTKRSNFRCRIRCSRQSGNLASNDSSNRSSPYGQPSEADHSICRMELREVKGQIKDALQLYHHWLQLISNYEAHIDEKITDTMRPPLALQNVKGSLAQSLKASVSDSTAWSAVHSLLINYSITQPHQDTRAFYQINVNDKKDDMNASKKGQGKGNGQGRSEGPGKGKGSKGSSNFSGYNHQKKGRPNPNENVMRRQIKARIRVMVNGLLQTRKVKKQQGQDHLSRVGQVRSYCRSMLLRSVFWELSEISTNQD